MEASSLYCREQDHSHGKQMEKKQTDIKINLRERVPYRLVQEENNLILNFEPSSIYLSSVNNSTFKKPETLPRI